MNKQELFGVLFAWRLVKQGSWPDLLPAMNTRAAQWPTMDEAALRREVREYLEQMNAPSCTVRVFWKLGADLTFAGCNDLVARDGGLSDASALLGKTDFDPSVPWTRQAAKYRADDLSVMAGGPRLDIVERQDSATGTTWLRTGKAPIRLASGDAVGLLGMYEVIDVATATRLNARSISTR